MGEKLDKYPSYRTSFPEGRFLELASEVDEIIGS